MEAVVSIYVKASIVNIEVSMYKDEIKMAIAS